MQRSNRNDVLKSSRKSDETLKQMNYVGITDVNNPEVLNQIKKMFPPKQQNLPRSMAKKKPIKRF